MEFIRTHQGRREAAGLVWGAEPICTMLTEHGLPMAPSTYCDHRQRLDQVSSPGRLAMSTLEAEVVRVHAAHYGVYGARKVWLQPNREGIPVARCTVERLMRRLDLHGSMRGKVKRTTTADRTARLPDNLVQRRFAPAAPDRL